MKSLLFNGVKFMENNNLLRKNTLRNSVLIFGLAIISAFSHAQELKKQIGINLAGDFNGNGAYSILSVNYTNQRHYVSLGTVLLNFDELKIRAKGVNCQYRIYPNVALKKFDLYFCAGFNFYRDVDRWSRNGFIYTAGDTDSYYASYENKNIKTGINLGFGFQLNFTKNFYFTTSFNNLTFYNVTKNKVVVQTDPIDILQRVEIEKRIFSQMFSISLCYNFDLKKEAAKSE